MKKLTILIVLLIPLLINGQTLFKGFETNMSKSASKLEFKNNRTEYTNVDLGNGFVWTMFDFGFIYDKKELKGITFRPKGGLIGIPYDNAVSYLEFSRTFFENKGYTVFYENDYWQYPQNFSGQYGLLMHNEDKTIVIHLFPYKGLSGGTWVYLAYMKVLNYDWIMNIFDQKEKELQQKSENSGF